MKAAALTFVFFAALASCATVEGVGEDISGGARRVSSWF